MSKIARLCQVSVFLFAQNISYASYNLHEDIKNLNQQKLRTYLHKNLSNVTDLEKERYKIDTSWFFLPEKISSDLKEKCILEVGCSVGASVRAFAKAKKVSVVEPDVNALSLAFDNLWTHGIDDLNINFFQYGSPLHNDESDTETCHRMNLDNSWVKNLNRELSWISDSVLIYPYKLEELPNHLNQNFDLIAYKDFNINDGISRFFEKASQLLNPKGQIVIQFWSGDYTSNNDINNPKLTENVLSQIEKYFQKIEYIYDKKGTKKVLSKNPLILTDYPNKTEIRFVILSSPKN